MTYSCCCWGTGREATFDRGYDQNPAAAHPDPRENLGFRMLRLGRLPAANTPSPKLRAWGLEACMVQVHTPGVTGTVGADKSTAQLRVTACEHQTSMHKCILMFPAHQVSINIHYHCRFRVSMPRPEGSEQAAMTTIQSWVQLVFANKINTAIIEQKGNERFGATRAMASSSEHGRQQPIVNICQTMGPNGTILFAWGAYLFLCNLHQSQSAENDWSQSTSQLSDLKGNNEYRPAKHLSQVPANSSAQTHERISAGRPQASTAQPHNSHFVDLREPLNWATSSG